LILAQTITSSKYSHILKITFYKIIEYINDNDIGTWKIPETHYFIAGLLDQKLELIISKNPSIF